MLGRVTFAAVDAWGEVRGIDGNTDTRNVVGDGYFGLGSREAQVSIIGVHR